MKKRIKIKEGDHRGSAMLVVLFLVSLIGITGLTVLYGAASNLKFRSLNRSARRDFYSAETALDETYTVLGQIAADSAGKSYEEVLKGLYFRYQTNEEANEAFSGLYLDEVEKALEIKGEGEDAKAGLALRIAGWREKEEGELTVQIGEILRTDEKQILLKNVQWISSASLGRTEGAVTADFIFQAPPVRFMEEEEGDCYEDSGEEKEVFDGFGDFLKVESWRKGKWLLEEGRKGQSLEDEESR